MTIQKKHFKHAKIIVNPFSGGGKHRFSFLDPILGISSARKKNKSAKENAEAVSKELKKYNISSTIHSTKCSGDATRLAQAAQNENYDVVIAMGGDGTINEIVNGLAHSTLPLAVIPLGTANVFSLEFNIPTHLKQACELIGKGNCQQIDLGKAGSKYFGCMAGIGFDAFVIKEADKKLKKKLGPLSYILISVLKFFNYPFLPIKITYDGSKTQKGYFLIIGNTKYYGGKFMATPHASPIDGFLDVCLFKNKNIFRVFCYLLQMKNGKIKKNNDVYYFKTKELTINEGHDTHIDAEYLCKTPITISIAPKAIWVVS